MLDPKWDGAKWVKGPAEIAKEQRDNRIQFYHDKLEQGDLTQEEMNKMARLERGMDEAARIGP